MVDAACRPILANQTWAIWPSQVSLSAAMSCLLFKTPIVHCAIHQSRDRKPWSIFQLDMTETGVLHYAPHVLAHKCLLEQGKSITAHQHAINHPLLPRPRQQELRQRACNLTPLDARVSLPKPRVQLDPAPPEPHLQLIQSSRSAVCPASRSINQSIHHCLAAPLPSTPAPHLFRVIVPRATHWGASPNWYHVDGNLAAKTRSTHPNGVVGV